MSLREGWEGWEGDGNVSGMNHNCIVGNLWPGKNVYCFIFTSPGKLFVAINLLTFVFYIVIAVTYPCVRSEFFSSSKPNVLFFSKTTIVYKLIRWIFFTKSRIHHNTILIWQPFLFSRFIFRFIDWFHLLQWKLITTDQLSVLNSITLTFDNLRLHLFSY